MNGPPPMPRKEEKKPRNSPISAPAKRLLTLRVRMRFSSSSIGVCTASAVSHPIRNGSIAKRMYL